RPRATRGGRAEAAQAVIQASLRDRANRVQPVCFRPQRGDLAVDPGERVIDDGPPLRGVRRRPEAVAIAGSGSLVLEHLGDLGEAETGLVTEALDESQPLDVIVVVEPVVATDAGRRRPG